MMKSISISKYQNSDDDILVDLRDRTSFSFGSIPGAVNIPVDELDRLYSLPKDKRIVLFCQIGEVSPEIAELLSENGYNTLNLAGGYREYLKALMTE